MKALAEGKARAEEEPFWTEAFGKAYRGANAEERRHLVYSLALMPAQEIGSHLCAALCTEFESSVRVAMLEAVTELRIREAADEVARSLKAAQPLERTRAAAALLAIGRVEPAYILLKDEGEQVAQFAAVVLARVHGSGMILDVARSIAPERVPMLEAVLELMDAETARTNRRTLFGR